VIAVYYHGTINTTSVTFNEGETDLLDHNWVPLAELSPSHFTFQMDKDALERFLAIQ
jgi:hypothetical protein